MYQSWYTCQEHFWYARLIVKVFEYIWSFYKTKRWKQPLTASPMNMVTMYWLYSGVKFSTFQQLFQPKFLNTAKRLDKSTWNEQSFGLFRHTKFKKEISLHASKIQEKKLSSNTLSVTFNETCIREGLLPNCYIYSFWRRYFFLCCFQILLCKDDNRSSE